MFKIFFGEFSNGRLLRLPYLGYTLLATAVFAGFVFGTIMLMGAAETMMGGDLAGAQQTLMNVLGIPFMIILGVVVLGLLVGLLNVMAKRVRDIGLPGWTFVLGFMVVSFIFSEFISVSASNGLSTIVGFGLLLTPHNSFGGNKA